VTGRCPICGSTQRDPIAPGFWRCRGSLLQTGFRMVPNENGPRSHTGEPVTMIQVPFEYDEPCLHEYPDGEAEKSPLCANCRDTYSIGVCASCQTPLCGKRSCSNLRAERRLCPKHAQRYDLEIAEAKAEEARQREARHKLAEQCARKLHNDIVAGRSKGSASDREIEAKVQELQRRIERAKERSIPAPPKPVILWLVVLTATYFIFSGISGGVGGISVLALVICYVLETVLIVFWAFAAESSGDISGLREKLQSLRLSRGCGSPDCKSCYPDMPAQT
jgi:hypothetical protein